MSELDDFLLIAIGLICYIFCLILLKKINVWKKKQCNNCSNCCPDCQDPLERIRRKRIDYIVNYITFQMFDFKRYKCMNCSWEGRKWERAFSGKF